MPRPNQPRSIASELAVARRVAIEREARGWSYDGLASRMTKAGCAIQSSAIYKIEKSDPPRRITVDELVAFSEVFGIPVTELLLPPEIAARKELLELVTAWDEARVRALQTSATADERWARLHEYVVAHPDLEPDLESAIRAWVEFYYGNSDKHGDWTAEYLIAQLTGSRSRKERAAEKFHVALAETRS